MALIKRSNRRHMAERSIHRLKDALMEAAVKVA